MANICKIVLYKFGILKESLNLAYQITNMKLSELATRLLKSRKTKAELALFCDVSEQTVYNWIAVNSDKLISPTAIKYFQSKGLTFDQIVDIEETVTH